VYMCSLELRGQDPADIGRNFVDGRYSRQMVHQAWAVSVRGKTPVFRLP
jgi:hypothetical protein